MIGALAQLLAAGGLTGQRSRWLAVGVIIAIAIVALWVALTLHDRRVIARHDADAAVAGARADRAADAAAAATRRSDDARLQAEADALEKVTDNALADPLAARSAYYACIRMQQQARAAGHITPACR
ncbi:MAG: hypothetical protein AB7E60_01725 [Sphingobium sp.]